MPELADDWEALRRAEVVSKRIERVLARSKALDRRLILKALVGNVKSS